MSPGLVAQWPYVSRHAFNADACVTGDTWVGYWPNWPGADEGWYLAADVGDDAGTGLTHVAPGVAEHAGWQSPSVIWDGIGNLGFMVEYNPSSCVITPTEEGSWGRIKALYTRQ